MEIIFGVGEILSSGWKTDNAVMKPQTIYGIQLLGGGGGGGGGGGNT